MSRDEFINREAAASTVFCWAVIVFFWVVVPTLVLCFGGCVSYPKTVEFQCVNAAKNKIDHIEGPVIVDENSILYYDSRGRLVKVEGGTCGVR